MPGPDAGPRFQGGCHGWFHSAPRGQGSAFLRKRGVNQTWAPGKPSCAERARGVEELRKPRQAYLRDSAHYRRRASGDCGVRDENVLSDVLSFQCGKL